jgi:hypothetical protein
MFIAKVKVDITLVELLGTLIVLFFLEIVARVRLTGQLLWYRRSEFLATNPVVSGSIHGAIRLSEK